MTKNYSTERYSKIICSILIAVALALVVGIITWAVIVSIDDAATDVSDKETLIANIESGYPAGAQNVTEAFNLWGFPSFNRIMVFNVESCYHNSYYKELPSNSELATKAADYFIENYYDIIDLSDKTAVTQGLANSFIAAVGDKYGIYRTKEEQQDYSSGLSGKIVGIGVAIKKSDDGLILVSSPIKDSPAEKAGILSGDFIIAIDGTYVKATDLISGTEGTEVTVRILRGDEEFDLSIVREQINDVSVTYEMLEGNIGYIGISKFLATTPEQFKGAIDALESAGARGIIFDLRSNPGGLLNSVVSTLSYIAPSGTEIVSFSNGSQTMTAKHGTALEPFDHVYTLPSILLINERTASAAELFTAGMRDFEIMGGPDVTIVGSTSLGKGVMQTGISFSDGSALTMTTAYYNPPSRINYDGVGITPNRTLTADEDALDTALEEIEILLSDGGIDGGTEM